MDIAFEIEEAANEAVRMLSQEIMAELDSKITYIENTLLLLCDVVAGIKETLAELNKDMPYVFCGQTADYKTKACFL